MVTTCRQIVCHLLMSENSQHQFVGVLKQQDYCINISQFYCHHWKLIHAIREVLQNWQDAYRVKYCAKKLTLQFVEQLGISTFYVNIDGIRNLENYIKYDSVEETLVFVNQGSFKIHNLLMGPSQKQHSEVALGQFGEGMKLYMLLLLKNGHPLFIESGDHFYGPSLKKWKYEYSGLVLHVHTKPRKTPKNNTVVTIRNITANMFHQFRYISLSMVSDYVDISFGKSTLIISDNPLLQGKIFKKGILVALRYKLDSPYSYNLDELQLGRQRDAINDPNQFKHLLSRLHGDILNNYKDLEKNRVDIADELPRHLDEVIKGCKKNADKTWFLHCYISSQAADRMYRKFLIQNNKQQLYPVHTSPQQKNIYQKLGLYGLKQQFYEKQSVSWSYACNLYKSSKYYQTIDQKITKQIKISRKLNDEEINRLKPITQNISLAIPSIKNYEFLIYEHEKIPCYKDPTKKIIHINKKEMNQPEILKYKLMEIIIKEILK